MFMLSVEEKKTKTNNNIVTAKNKIRSEIQELNDRLKNTREAITKFNDEITKLENPSDKG